MVAISIDINVHQNSFIEVFIEQCYRVFHNNDHTKLAINSNSKAKSMVLSQQFDYFKNFSFQL
jgi:hypothetical protein